MNRAAILMTTLSLLGLALVVPGRPAGAVPNDTPFVAVDPNDLRKPIPDPEQGLTEKYDGKVVRFTGALRRWSLDKKAKKYTYELHYDFVKAIRVKGKSAPPVKEETIIVPVTFQQDLKQLRARQPG